MAKHNNPHLSFLSRLKLIWEEDDDFDAPNDETHVKDDDVCPTLIYLNTKEKQRLREPWRHALIFKLLVNGLDTFNIIEKQYETFVGIFHSSILGPIIMWCDFGHGWLQPHLKSRTMATW